MSNKHASKQHCLVGNNRPKSKLRKRKNKAKARERREARLEAAAKPVKKAEPKTGAEGQKPKTEPAKKSE